MTMTHTSRMTVWAASSVLAFSMLMPAAGAVATPTTSPSAGAKPQTLVTKEMAAIKAKAVQEIDRRINALTELSVRVQGMKRVSDAEKQTIANEVQSQITMLTTLRAKIEADTVLATLRADVKSIVDAYRIFRLVIPQAQIIVSADRISTIVNSVNDLVAKLNTRISTAQAAGRDVTAMQTAMTDLAAKLTDATTQAQNAATAVAALKPDNGDAAKLKANQDALKNARTLLQAAREDIRAALKDAHLVMDELRGVHASPAVSPSSSPSVSPVVSATP